MAKIDKKIIMTKNVAFLGYFSARNSSPLYKRRGDVAFMRHAALQLRLFVRILLSSVSVLFVSLDSMDDMSVFVEQMQSEIVFVGCQD